LQNCNQSMIQIGMTGRQMSAEFGQHFGRIFEDCGIEDGGTFGGCL